MITLVEVRLSISGRWLFCSYRSDEFNVFIYCSNGKISAYRFFCLVLFCVFGWFVFLWWDRFSKNIELSFDLDLDTLGILWYKLCLLYTFSIGILSPKFIFTVVCGWSRRVPRLNVSIIHVPGYINVSSVLPVPLLYLDRLRLGSRGDPSPVSLMTPPLLDLFQTLARTVSRALKC